MNSPDILIYPTQEEHDQHTRDKIREVIEHNFALHLQIGDDCCREWFFEIARDVYNQFEKDPYKEGLRIKAGNERRRQAEERKKQKVN
jgi:hypothetical protein